MTLAFQTLDGYQEGAEAADAPRPQPPHGGERGERGSDRESGSNADEVSNTFHNHY